MKPTYYSEVSEGANLVHQQILAAARKNPEIRTLYKGCQLLFRLLLEKTEYFFDHIHYRWRIKLLAK